MRDDDFERGLDVRRAILGSEHVEHSLANATDFTRDFQEFVTRYAWGDVWSRPGLDHKTRSLLTIAMLASLGRHDELRLHVRATRNTGVTRAEVREVLLQVAVYAGVPAANSAYQHAAEVYAEIDAERAP